jgi:hypothetical protein
VLRSNDSTSIDACMAEMGRLGCWVDCIAQFTRGPCFDAALAAAGLVPPARTFRQMRSPVTRELPRIGRRNAHHAPVGAAHAEERPSSRRFCKTSVASVNHCALMLCAVPPAKLARLS